jgi:hypothetical protein
MEKNNERADDGAPVEVRCVEESDGVLTVVIRTLTDEDLERMSRAPRRAPKRVH